ncbi:MAG: Cys-Xaa-Xaa-Xaa repeat radical SAM target protein [Bacteroides sp.]|nr:Cys-Xaa-Xaa-Xaa repeat radical SAM target protein [Bacteroides sp.]
MKQNQNGELQSRRSFFKNAAKAALPILGAIALANVPVLGNATTIGYDCDNSCSNSCKGRCTGGCQTSCAADGCGHTCAGNCRGHCNATCRDSCYNDCTRTSKK